MLYVVVFPVLSVTVAVIVVFPVVPVLAPATITLLSLFGFDNISSSWVDQTHFFTLSESKFAILNRIILFLAHVILSYFILFLVVKRLIAVVFLLTELSKAVWFSSFGVTVTVHVAYPSEFSAAMATVPGLCAFINPFAWTVAMWSLFEKYLTVLAEVGCNWYVLPSTKLTL